MLETKHFLTKWAKTKRYNNYFIKCNKLKSFHDGRIPHESNEERMSTTALITLAILTVNINVKYLVISALRVQSVYCLITHIGKHRFGPNQSNHSRKPFRIS